MLGLMGYTLIVTMLLAASGWAAERVALVCRTPARWVWVMAIVGSLVLPAAVPSVSFDVPMLAAEGPAKTIALRDMTSATLTPTAWLPGQAPAPVPNAAGGLALDTALTWAWAVSSGALLLALLGSAVHLSVCKRRWQREQMAGAAVYLSPDVGPAVVGLLRPRIVVPSWLAGAPEHQQTLVIAHEQSHLDARDPQWLTLCLLVLVAMPWNLPLWWLMRRLRRAIEVDCDARVLAAGYDLKQYGATLIEVGQRQSGFVGAAAAMAESRSFLEQRIGIMLRPPKRWARRAAPVFAAFSLCMVAVAAQVGPPAKVRHEIAMPAGAVANYVGYYQIDEHEVMVVSQAGKGLVAQRNRGKTWKLRPEGETAFFVRGADMQVRFDRAANGRPAAGLVLSQYGVDLRAPRVGADVVQQVDAHIEQRIALQRPAAGGEAAVRRNLELARGGRLELADFTPSFGQIALRTLPRSRQLLNELGAVRSVKFNGVSRHGWDMYEIEYEHGAAVCQIAMNSDGKVANVLFHKKG
ncbi:MAG: M56 family metallopeptidase [Pseudomonadota bacterium]